ncbi:MAG: SCP2 sterol-binding domain-containing protein [Anaerobacillus sp.]|uniref:SCP2 sterol-binding domain-containing protein n=1 Tax=Anaerobacillus sp. TaxID=1872506 RepID=UPI00391D4B81
MQFERVLQGFQQRLKEASQLQAYLRENPFVIAIEVNSNIYTLRLSSDHEEFSKNSYSDEKVNLTIQGNEEVIERLLKGLDRLQKLERQKELTVQGNYSAILKAETIFYLNNALERP